MGSFKAVFKIIEDNNCPLYRLEEHLVLSEKALTFPKDKEGCLILVREMTQLLFELLDEMEKEDAGGKKPRVFTCSGCTGLIKFIRVDSDASEYGVQEDSLLTAVQQVLMAKISGYPLVKAFPQTQLKRFVDCLQEQVVYSGSYLIIKGEINEHLYIILSGEVSVEDDQVKITTLREGDVCGEMSYFGNKIAKSSIRAMRETKVLGISGDDFGRLMGEAASLQLFMAKLLAERLAKSNTVRTREFEACMHGRIKDMAPAELFQIFHMHQKTGALSLELSRGNAKVSFREGCIINASYADKHNQDAIFSILAEKEGVYRFTVGLSPQEMKAAEIGDFMMLLMEGVKRVDEVNESEGPLS
jgi:CRP/FNR family transcriptional regulator, cyclic AMP receptor protein